MDWEAIYKQETGNDASYEKIDEGNAYRTHAWCYDEYICWLEDKLTDIAQLVIIS